jgi:hypothetical protein
MRGLLLGDTNEASELAGPVVDDGVAVMSPS